MNKDKIQTIQLNSFRGATKLVKIDFNKKKSMVMIFGGNGTGKSTIIDAIDFIFNKQCGSLKEKSSTNIKNHLPALGFTSQDVKVFIKTKKGHEFKGSLEGVKPEIKGNNNLLSVEILRRDKVLKLINAQPKERYDELKNFIELPSIRSSEETLRECIRDIGKDLDNETSTNQKQIDTLENSWKGEGKPENNFRKWAKHVSGKNDQELKNINLNYKKLIDLIIKADTAWEELEKAIQECDTSKKELETANSNLQNLSGESQPEEIIDILTKTQLFLQKQETTEECPACEQPIVPNNLKERITERLKNMKNLVKANEKFKKAKTDHESSQERQSESENLLKESVQKLIDTYKEKNSIIEIEKNHKKF